MVFRFFSSSVANPKTWSGETTNMKSLGVRPHPQIRYCQHQAVPSIISFWTCGKIHCLLPPTNAVCEGYVFTGVCLSTGGQVSASGLGGEYLPHPPGRSPWADPLGRPPGQTPLGKHPRADTPRADTPGQTPPGRHPQGRHPLPSVCWDTQPPVQCMLGYTHPLPSTCWDTVNKRAVRIPLNAFLFLEMH